MESLRIAVLVLVSFCCVGVFANGAAMCGRVARKVKFGAEKSIFSPNTTDPFSCRYKIVVSLGLHIRVTFSELDTDTCCSHFKVYDAHTRPFRWQDTRILPMPSNITTPGTTVILPTAVAGIRHQRISGTGALSIRFGAVIPEGGNCGYVLEPLKRLRVLKSPGWPRVRSPAGLSCSWIVRPKQDHILELDLSRIWTHGDEDYVEVYEGATLLGRYSGNVKTEVKHITRSQFRIYLHTSTPNSRGFRATYIEIPENKTEISTFPTLGKVIKCYNGTKVSGMGIVMMNEMQEAQCPAGNDCGLYLLRGTTRNLGDAEIVSETGLCVPEGICTTDMCSNIPSNQDLTVTSCEATCCSTDLCNGPPGSEVTPPVPEKLIKCNNGTKVNGMGMMLVNEGHVIECPPLHICGLYLVRGTSRNFGDNEISTETGACVPEGICAMDLCSTIPSNPDLTVTSCKATCCRTDFCNTSPATTPSETSDTLKCYEILSSMGGNMTLVDNKAEKTCNPGSKCSRVVAKATSSLLPADVEITTIYGGCLTETACNYLNCSLLPSSVSDMTIASCEASCCDGDLCNGGEVTDLDIVTPSQSPGAAVPGTSLICYDIFHSEGGEMTFVDTKTEKTCSVGSKCLYMVAVSESSGIQVTNIYGSCLPSAVCNSMDCSAVLTDLNNTTIKSCEVTCCDTDYCNGKRYEQPKKPDTVQGNPGSVAGN